MIFRYDKFSLLIRWLLLNRLDLRFAIDTTVPLYSAYCVTPLRFL